MTIVHFRKPVQNTQEPGKKAVNMIYVFKNVGVTILPCLILHLLYVYESSRKQSFYVYNCEFNIYFVIILIFISLNTEHNKCSFMRAEQMSEKMTLMHMYCFINHYKPLDLPEWTWKVTAYSRCFYLHYTTKIYV